MSDNPLENTPDMEGLTPAERARSTSSAPRRPASAGRRRPARTARRRRLRAAPQPARLPAERPAAAAAGRWGGAGALTPEQRERLAAAVQRGAGGGARSSGGSDRGAGSGGHGTPGAVEAQSERLVYVWPHLVTIEFLAAVLMLVSMIVISMVIQAPLEGHRQRRQDAEPVQSSVVLPEPSGAAAAHAPVAGRRAHPVGRPGADPAHPLLRPQQRGRRQVVRDAQGARDHLFTTVYTTIWLFALVLFDEFIVASSRLMS